MALLAAEEKKRRQLEEAERCKAEERVRYLKEKKERCVSARKELTWSLVRTGLSYEVCLLTSIFHRLAALSECVDEADTINTLLSLLEVALVLPQAQILHRTIASALASSVDCFGLECVVLFHQFSCSPHSHTRLLAADLRRSGCAN